MDRDIDLLGNDSILPRSGFIKIVDKDMYSDIYSSVYGGMIHPADRGWNTVGSVNVKDIIEGLLDSSNPDVKENVDLVLKYLISKLDPIVEMDTPIEEFIKQEVDSNFIYNNEWNNRNAKEDLINFLKVRGPERLVALEQENKDLKDKVMDLECALNRVETILNMIIDRNGLSY